MDRIRRVGLALALLLLGAARIPGQELGEKTYAGYRAFLQPKSEELRWQGIAWRPALWTAVVEAHRVKKPILLWAMNGHPLACT